MSTQPKNLMLQSHIPMPKITIDIPDHLFYQLQAAAKLRKITMSELITEILENHYSNKKQTK